MNAKLSLLIMLILTISASSHGSEKSDWERKTNDRTQQSNERANRDQQLERVCNTIVNKLEKASQYDKETQIQVLQECLGTLENFPELVESKNNMIEKLNKLESLPSDNTPAHKSKTTTQRSTCCIIS